MKTNNQDIWLMFQNMSAVFTEAGPGKSKQRSSHDWSHLRLLYIVQSSAAERERDGNRDRETPAAHTLMCMLRSIKLA